MKHFLLLCGLTALLLTGDVGLAWSADDAPRAASSGPARSKRAYGEWRIQIRPDKLDEYAELIEAKGLPLFREAGGRMVGWWTTLVGDLYEHVTIWEYDSMTAFEHAVEKLGKDKRFAEFAALRDPLLVGEQSRFLHLVDFAVDPTLPELSKVVVHETLRIPLDRRDEYLKFMRAEGMSLLKQFDLRPVGPWVVGVGKWTEITWLFLYDSLQERDKLVTALGSSAEGRAYSAKINALAEEVTTRVLLPAPFAHGTAPAKP